MLDTLLVLVLSVHLLAANLAGAAPLVCIWLDMREVRRQDSLAGDLGRYLLRASLVAITAALLLGAATLGVVWLTDWQPFYETASRLPPSRYWWAVPEVLFFYVCLGGYLALWKKDRHGTAARRILRRFLGLIASTNLLYHFPLLFTVIGIYATRPEDAAEPLVFRHALADTEVLSQFLHYLLASFAVVGVTALGYALRLARIGAPIETMQRVAAWGARLAVVPTVLQLFVGLYVLLELPDRARSGLMGRDTLGTLLFGVSLVAAIVLMHRLGGIAAGDAEPRDLKSAMALLVIVVVAMVGTRHRARHEASFGRVTVEPVAAAPHVQTSN